MINSDCATYLLVSQALCCFLPGLPSPLYRGVPSIRSPWFPVLLHSCCPPPASIALAGLYLFPPVAPPISIPLATTHPQQMRGVVYAAFPHPRDTWAWTNPLGCPLPITRIFDCTTAVNVYFEVYTTTVLRVQVLIVRTVVSRTPTRYTFWYMKSSHFTLNT